MFELSFLTYSETNFWY